MAQGTARPIEAVAKEKPRIRLAAMRIIASYDRLSIQERKLDLLENPTGERPVPEVEDEEPDEASNAAAKEALALIAKSRCRPARGGSSRGNRRFRGKRRPFWCSRKRRCASAGRSRWRIPRPAHRGGTLHVAGSP